VCCRFSGTTVLLLLVGQVPPCCYGAGSICLVSHAVIKAIRQVCTGTGSIVTRIAMPTNLCTRPYHHYAELRVTNSCCTLLSVVGSGQWATCTTSHSASMLTDGHACSLCCAYSCAFGVPCLQPSSGLTCKLHIISFLFACFVVHATWLAACSQCGSVKLHQTCWKD